MSISPTKAMRFLFLATALPLVAIGAYVLFVDVYAQDLASEDVASRASVVNGDFLATLERIQLISLDGSLFTSELFASLRDLTVEVSPQPVGRDNPFAPLPGRSSSQR
jgi:hypothetical protein